METLVLGWMPRAGLLLLPLLLCFGPETAGSIDPRNLNVIVNYVKTNGGVNHQYAFAVSLSYATCNNPQQELDKDLNKSQFDEMRNELSQADGLYNHGNIVAARPRDFVEQGRKYTEHSEWRLLHGQNSLVALLKKRTYGQNSCLILFTYISPCTNTCLRQDGPFNILQMTYNAFSDIDNNYKAFVFQKIYDKENMSQKDLLDAWHRLDGVPLLRCDNNRCHNCAGTDTENHPCLAGMK